MHGESALMDATVPELFPQTSRNLVASRMDTLLA